MVLDPKHKPLGMQQNAIDYDGPISVIRTAGLIGGIIGHLVSEPGFGFRQAGTNN